MSDREWRPWLPRSPLAEWQDEAGPKTKYHLGSSQCRGPDLARLLSLAPDDQKEQWQNLSLSPYASSRGGEPLRREIAKWYPGLDCRHVVTFAGAQEAMTLAFLTLLQPGDEVLVPSPAFPPLYQLPHALRARLKTVPLRRLDRAWSFDTERVLQAMTDKTKLIVLNFPHNPTGATLSQESLDAIIAKARLVGAWIFSDEVFRGLEFSAALSSAGSVASLYERGLSLGVTSKCLGLAGVRIGWLASQEERILEHIRHAKDYFSICNGVCDEFLAELALQNREPLQKELAAKIELNAQAAARFFLERKEAFEWMPPAAGPVCFPKLLKTADSRAYARALLEKGVQVVPGHGFGDDEAYLPHFRLGLGLDDFSLALELLGDAL